MNKDVLKGNWKQMKGEAQKQWGKLTDDDLDRIDGDQEKLEGKLQEAYGYDKEKAHSEVDAWMQSRR